MRSRYLKAAMMKVAVGLRPFNTGDMAGYGGLAGGLLGAGAGALTGLVGTEAGTPERRKAMLRRGLLGLLAGGGIGAATGGMAASNAREKVMEATDYNASQDAMNSPLSRIVVDQLAQQKNQKPLEYLLENPSIITTPVAQETHKQMSSALDNMKMGPTSALKILTGDNPLLPTSGAHEEFNRQLMADPFGSQQGRIDSSWNIIKQLGLDPNRGGW